MHPAGDPTPASHVHGMHASAGVDPPQCGQKILLFIIVARHGTKICRHGSQNVSDTRVGSTRVSGPLTRHIM